ncbi:uncharacterized protein LOC112150608 [Oryzias melastigma]|uniref:uncharacterized protein LOC112150608 n=1 Tax=Oryzias melastigma TaxID=30732 RepID=UPI000CF82B07|nr:uncharacterized protein LOC112150608 [Oryzias melastigma]
MLMSVSGFFNHVQHSFMLQSRLSNSDIGRAQYELKKLRSYINRDVVPRQQKFKRVKTSILPRASEEVHFLDTAKQRIPQLFESLLSYDNAALVTEHNLLMGYIMGYLSIISGHRSTVIREMEASDVMDADSWNNGRVWQILVGNHKTGWSGQPCDVWHHTEQCGNPSGTTSVLVRAEEGGLGDVPRRVDGGQILCRPSKPRRSLSPENPPNEGSPHRGQYAQRRRRHKHKRRRSHSRRQARPRRSPRAHTQPESGGVCLLSASHHHDFCPASCQQQAQGRLEQSRRGFPEAQHQQGTVYTCLHVPATDLSCSVPGRCCSHCAPPLPERVDPILLVPH